MEPENYDYCEDYYYYLEDYEEDSGPHSEQGTVASAGEGQQRQDASENLQGKLNNGQVPDKDLDAEGDQSDQKSMEPDQEEPAFPLAAVPKRQGRRYPIQFHFTQWQVQEMETVFQETQYPDVLTRGVLARSMDVPEAKVQMWFNNRRAKQRAREKKAVLRSTPVGTQDHICMMDPEDL